MNKIIEWFVFNIQLAIEILNKGQNLNQLLKLAILPGIENIIDDFLWKIRANDIF